MSKKWREIPLIKPKSILVIAVGIASILGNSGLLLAESYKSIDNYAENAEISFIPVQQEPPDRGTPKSEEGTGSRGNCFHKPSLPPLTSLAGTNHLKLTTRDRPTFWVYLPYTQAEAAYGEFSLQNGDNDIYRTRFQLPTKPGIVSVNLPSTVAPLEVGKQYRWYLDINCSALASPDDLSTPACLTGIVERVYFANNFLQELNIASKPINRIAIYAKHGIWYDAVTELAQLRLQQPENPTLKQTWHKLLSDRHVNLEDISSEPILGEVKITDNL